MFSKIPAFLISRIAWLYLIFVGKTSRIYWLNCEKREQYEARFGNVLYAFWHGRQFFFPYAYRKQYAATLVSQSKDGEYIARVLHLFGMGTVRGSSSRGGMRALVELKKALESGRDVAVTPDGPKGPKRSVAPGILYLSQKSAKPILPITYSAKRKIVFHGWDDYWVPLPFNTIIINYGNPISISSANELEGSANQLAQELSRTTEEADQMILKGGLNQHGNIIKSDRLPSYPVSLLESFLFFLYNAGFILFSPFILMGIFFRYPKTFLKYFYNGLLMRLGVLDRSSTDLCKNIPYRKSIWIHACSLGECRAAFPLVRAIRNKYQKVPIVFSCTTFTGIAEANRLHLGDTVFYAPIDLPIILKKVFNKVQPAIILLLESEIWPNWLKTAKEYHAKIGIVNGRISQKSAERYAKMKWISKFLTNKIDFVCAREDSDAKRFEMIGIQKEKIQTTGNLKFDFLPWQLNNSFSGEAQPADLNGKIIWTAGSVREGEEQLVLDTFYILRKKFTELKLIFAPRHLENLNGIFHVLNSQNLKYQLRSNQSEVNKNQGWDVLIWDTFGDLWKAYQWSTIVFVGGSLVPKGGQNPIEPAWFSKPILFGPYMDNFSDPAEALLKSNGAVQVNDVHDMVLKMEELLSSPEKMHQIGQNAQKTVERFSGQATQKTIQILESFIRA